MKQLIALNCENYTSEKIETSGVELNLYAHGDFGTSGEVAIQLYLDGENNVKKYVEFPSLIFTENTIKIIKIPNISNFRVVTRDCVGVNIQLDEKA